MTPAYTYALTPRLTALSTIELPIVHGATYLVRALFQAQWLAGSSRLFVTTLAPLPEKDRLEVPDRGHVGESQK